MAKIRHIAFRSENVEATASLLREVFDLQLVQRRERGAIDLSDGDVNITVLPMRVGAPGQEVRPGLEHIGFTVEDEAETRRRFVQHGGRELPQIELGGAYYEAKFLSTEGLVIDVGHWAGGSPIGVSATPTAESEQPVGAPTHP